MKKLLKLSEFCCAITISLLYLYACLTNNVYFNGVIILISLLLLLNPTINFFRKNKKKILNPIYNLGVIILCIYIIFIITKNIILVIDINNINESVLFVANRLLFLLVATIILNVISCFLPKATEKSKTDNSKFMLMLIILTSVLPFFRYTADYNRVFSFVQCIFNFVLLRRYNILDEKDFKKGILINFILGLISFNPIAIFSTIYLLNNNVENS